MEFPLFLLGKGIPTGGEMGLERWNQRFWPLLTPGLEKLMMTGAVGASGMYGEGVMVLKGGFVWGRRRRVHPRFPIPEITTRLLRGLVP